MKHERSIGLASDGPDIVRIAAPYAEQGAVGAGAIDRPANVMIDRGFHAPACGRECRGQHQHAGPHRVRPFARCAEIPSRFILLRNVEGGTPSTRAAPRAPSMAPRWTCNTRVMYARSCSS